MNNHRTNLPPFEPVTSKPSKAFNYGYGISIVFSAVVIVSILIALPFLLDFDESVLIISILLILTIVLMVVYVRKTMKHTTIIIDNSGIHYINKYNDKVEKTTLWNNFQKIEEFKGKINGVNSFSDADLLQCDVFAKMVGSGKYSHEAFFWFILENEKVEVHKETFSGNHIFSMMYSNKLELVRSLLLGLVHFRPDLKVHSKAFSLYYINPENYNIEYEKRKEDINIAVFVTALVVIITIFIMLFVFF
ncbi:hypothetical protein [Flavobacterium sp.]|uniref:hypothetical protein n=1 Tax=Flavobacterium sp. TaxID=239 RepID=UPI0031DD884D